jgi:SAM-dependent methyltransferase
VETNGSAWHRAIVGGLWDEMGQRQLDFLVGHGLRPEHYVLDVGCGSLRAGVKLIDYLEPGHYYGIDRDAELLRCGREYELSPDLLAKAPILAHVGDFDFRRLARQFDVALAQSVFTHLPLNEIARCLVRVPAILEPRGVFYATFFENERGLSNLEPLEWSTADGLVITTYLDRDPYHYDFGTFQWLGQQAGLKVSYLGDWDHPRRQRMLAFERRSSCRPAA